MIDMIVKADDNMTTLSCSNYGREYVSAFQKDNSIDDMIAEFKALLYWMGFHIDTINEHLFTDEDLDSRGID